MECMVQVLVTGSAGFIGSHLVETLEQNGHDVLGIDRELPDDANRYGTNDVADEHLVEQVFADHAFDAVFHLAAEADVWCSAPSQIYADNIQAVRNVAEYADRYGVPLVFTSTIGAKQPQNAYSYSKVAGEQILKMYDNADFFRHRLTNVVGAGAVRGQVYDMIEEGLDGEIEVWGNGEIRRGYVAVQDVVDVLIETVFGEFGDDAIGTATMTNQAVAEIIRDVLEADYGRDVTVTPVDRTPPSPMSLVADQQQPLDDPTPIETAVRQEIDHMVSE